MSFNGLPTELKLRVFQRLSVDDLRSVRLVQTSTFPLATSLLFKTIHLKPCQRSFDKALLAAKAYGGQVSKVVYEIEHRAKEGRQALYETLRSSMPGEIPGTLLNELCSNSYGSQGGGFTWAVERSAMEELCKQLPNVTSLAMVGNKELVRVLEQVPHIDLDSWVLSRSDCLLDAFWDAPIQDLHLQWFDCWDLSYVASRRLGCGTLPQNLRRLHLTFADFDYVWLGDSALFPDSFSTFLRASQQSLTSLTLDFTRTPSLNKAEFRTLCACVLGQKWDRLQAISLCSILAEEDQLVSFFAKHESSLQTVHLADVEINNNVPDFTSPFSVETPGSIISFFYRLHAAIHPTTVQLAGVFTNSHTEAWKANRHGGATERDAEQFSQEATEASLRAGWERFLSHRGPSPFPTWKEYLELQAPRYEAAGFELNDEEREELFESPLAAEWEDDTWLWHSSWLTVNMEP